MEARPHFRSVVTPVVALACLVAAPARADLVDPAAMPGPLRDVTFEQRLGDKLPLDARFRDEVDRDVALGNFFGTRPVVLVFGYYRCPMLCSVVFSGLSKALGVLSLEPGRDFDVVAISIAPRETAADARAAKDRALADHGRAHTADGWHFLTGGEPAIRRAAAAAGFRYALVPETGEYAHAGGLLVATPDGTLSRYFYGVEFAPKDLRLALVESSAGRIGSAVDQILLYCFRYDPELGKYTAAIMRIVRLSGALFCVALGAFLWILLYRERQAARRESPTLGAA